MKTTKRKKLEAAGWKVADTKDFLGLSEEEIALIETKRALMKTLREARQVNNITQVRLAEMINSSQSRVAKMEASSPDISLDLILKALFALGVSRKKVGRVIASVA